MIIAVDFDGTLCEDKFPEIGKPIICHIRMVKRLQQKGHEIILWTSRNGKMLEEAVAWCAGYGLHFDAVNENLPDVKEKWGGDTRKVFADYYFDDKNIGALNLIRLSTAE